MAAQSLFTKIINRDIPADIVYEDEDIIGIKDIAPKAPIHCLFIPKRAIPTSNDLDNGDASLVGKLVLVAAAYARQQGIADDGYRLVMNCNRHGGQSVHHIHLHLLGGRQLQWPPG